MKIYTSYYSKISSLIKNNILPISISRTSPPGINLKKFSQLTPSWELLNFYKKTNDKDFYIKEFNRQLESLSAKEIVHALESISEGQDVALICYEAPRNFCHRQLVAKWLVSNGYDCQEWIF